MADVMDQNIVNQLVGSIVGFLRSQLEFAGRPGNLSEEGAESVEVAVQCLETAYGITQAASSSPDTPSLYTIFSEGAGRTPTSQPTTEDVAEAENLKTVGNQLMREENFADAVDSYTRAISRDPTNAVYYCNRAAAHSKLNNHFEAIEDCKRALRIEPQYSKAYGRMGLAFSALDKSKEAFDCYKKALELEPDNDSYRSNLSIAEEKMNSQPQTQSQQGAAVPNPFAAMAGGGGGGGGQPGAGFNLGNLSGFAGLSGLGGGAGGVPGEAGMQNVFNNPDLMNLASTLMSDPNMQNMMSSFLSSMSGSAGAPNPDTPPTAPAVPPPPPTTETSATSQGGGDSPGSFSALLNAGRHLAEQMQNQNPELVEQLRSQMNRRMPGSQPPDDNSPDGQNPPPGNS